MLKALRRLKISLATKCQLLFGVAVVLVVGAALFVPWQRMEQLSEQPNESAARLLTDALVQDHAQAARRPAAAMPLFRIGIAPATQPAEPNWQHRVLIGTRQIDDPHLTRFEALSIRAFQHDPDLQSRGSVIHSTDRYRYARPLYARGNCLDCHTVPPMLAGGGVSAATADPPLLLGIASVDIPSQSSDQQQLLNRVLLLVAGLIAGTLAGVTLYLIITRIILKPVRVLQETAEKVSAGDLNIRSHIHSGDEFQQLSETFNQMLVNLKGSNDKLQEMNKSLDVRLGQLAEANSTLFQANKLKSEFLANVSHELRTPLNSILGFADLLRDGLPADAKQSRYLQNIIKAGHNLLDLINDLLDLAKIEAGKLDVRAQPLSLGDLFEGLVNLLRPLLEAKKLSVDVRVDGGVPILETDPSRLQQVLYNLLSNAIKFSPVQDHIELHAETTPAGRIRIDVIDHGPGIARAMHGVIFEKFRQGDQSHTREHGGTGLGLSIAKELAGLLGGSIGVDSEAGHGARFWCELPVKIESGERQFVRTS